MSAPKKIWTDPLFWHSIGGTYTNHGVEIHKTPYIRADIVDGLAEALKTCRFSGYTDIDGDYITTQHFDGPKVRAALKALEEE